MDGKALIYLFIGIPILLFNLIYCYLMFSGEIYKEDEEELRKRPYSSRSKEIRRQRQNGTYDVYIPPNQRNKNDNAKKGGDE